MPPALRRSGYASRLYEWGYGSSGPLYDAIVRWGMWPLGGDAACRLRFVDWLDVAPHHRVLSLCCGSGRTERALLASFPGLSLTALDLGAGQLLRARRRAAGPGVRWLRADASRVPLTSGRFDRVYVVLALHEMPGALRTAVLGEATRCCRPGGRVLAVEHARPESRPQRLLQALWWLYWIPGNPEASTSLAMQRKGLHREMVEAGLEVVARHRSPRGWLEGTVGRPRA